MSLSASAAGTGPLDVMHGPHDAGHATLPPKRHGAAAAGLAGAVFVMILSLTALVGGADSARFGGTAVGDLAAEFSLPSVAGERVALTQFRGRPVLLIFATTPLADVTADRPLPAHTAVLAVLPLAEPDVRTKLQKQLGASAEVLSDADGAVAEQYQITAHPAAVLIGADGRVLDRGAPGEVLGRLH